MGRPPGSLTVRVALRRIREGEEIKFNFGNYHRAAWHLIHLALLDGKPLRLSGLKVPASSQRALHKWARRNTDLYPILKKLKTAIPDEEGVLIIFFDPRPIGTAGWRKKEED